MPLVFFFTCSRVLRLTGRLHLTDTSPPSRPTPSVSASSPDNNNANACADALLRRARAALLLNQPSGGGVPWPVALPAAGMALFALYMLFGHLLLRTSKCITCV
eukprot:2526424-Pyramimonas_sp.AAC.2